MAITSMAAKAKITRLLRAGYGVEDIAHDHPSLGPTEASRQDRVRAVINDLRAAGSLSRPGFFAPLGQSKFGASSRAGCLEVALTARAPLSSDWPGSAEPGPFS